MDPTPAPYMIRIHGHLGATVLSAFPALVPRRQGADTVLIGVLDRSALYGVLAEIEALGLRPGRNFARAPRGGSRAPVSPRVLIISAARLD